MSRDKRLWIDGCAGSELKDIQGETLSVEGADISELEAGRAFYNDNHGKGFTNHLGMITEAKKIFKAEDCENERHTHYWNKIKAPYIYAKGYLHNNEDHANARAAAAIIKNIHREDCPLKVKMSVEGGIIARGVADPSRLVRTKLAGVALTFTPANTATLVEPLNLDKSSTDWETDQQLIKSVIHLAETNIPSFRHIERHASANTIHDNILKIQELSKVLGIDIEVKSSDPKVIMEQAVISKISKNIQKINDLTKQLQKAVDYKDVMNPARLNKPVGGTPIRQAADEVRTGNLAAKDEFQQKIGQLKTDPTTPAVPKDLSATPNTARTKSAEEFKAQNIVKRQASLAMKDPAHLDTIKTSLASRGVTPEKIQQVLNHVKLHMVKSESVEPRKDELKDKLKKALMAGFGGAGASTDLTGGGVLQPESLDAKSKKKRKFTTKRLIKSVPYVTCEDCGHEQAYMQHQVKCRSCGHNFNFSKLQNLI